MTWTLSVTAAGGGTVSAALRDPELGDVETLARRQRVAETDGGQLHVQDLLVEDRFLDVSWPSLSRQERSDLRRVLQAADWRGRDLQVAISGGGHDAGGWALPLAADQTDLAGDTLASDQGLESDTLVHVGSATIGGLRLEQPSVEWQQQHRAFASVSLRFRLPDPQTLVGG